MKFSGLPRKKILMTTAMAALATALAGGATAQADDVSAGQIPSVQYEYSSSLVAGSPDQSDPATSVVVDTGSRWLAVTALSGLLASAFTLFGANRLLQFFASAGNWLGSSTKKAASASWSATKATASAAGRVGARVSRKPMRVLFLVGGLTLFALTGIAWFDIEWQAGLLTGAGAASAAAYGFDRTGKFVRNLMAKVPGRRRAEQVKPA